MNLRASDNIHLQALHDAGILHGLVAHIQAQHVFERQHVRAPQIVIRIGRWKAVEMSAADSGKDQRIRLSRNDTIKPGVDIHADLAPVAR